MSGNSKEKVSLNLHDLPRDPGLRTVISKLDPNIQDEVRRAYLQMGPFQPQSHDFPTRLLGEKSRRFVRSWFDNYLDWLEYSIVKDAAFCLYCYVFREENGSQGVGPCFTGEGFRNWKKKEMSRQHVGGVNSAHNIARRRCESLMNQKAHVATFFFNHSKKIKREYRLCLTAVIDCIRFLLRQGLAFCGNNESQSSDNRGNFLLANHNEEIKGVIFNNAPANLQMTSPDIQKQIVSVCSAETSRAIIKEIGDSLFSVMIDESRDISTKEQMAVVLCYVDKRGHVVERFIGIEHVIDTKAVSLKASLDIVFARHGLSMSRLRGQGYDGASNMQGVLNGLKTLILKENESAYYIHCFPINYSWPLFLWQKSTKKLMICSV
ncbi:zinc finger MYM-type protein 1-like [Citrus clementina]|uniref:zinc finger MYM-type protein 1-like n=1 Tax=Citrus clementina TaxID=85681 RepID=UPI000CED35CF|nr:zinc finger MYM-type protein 1-like [Citrus x clementina]